MPSLIDLTGQRFGRLVVLIQNKSRNGNACWSCLCDCGKKKTIRADVLKGGTAKSCGCWRNEVNGQKRLLKARGSKHYNWKGGITPEHRRIRASLEYAAWRTSVFVRDNYKCQACGVRGGSLEAHHIKSFAKFPELRLEISNGQTLCVPCHKNIF